VGRFRRMAAEAVGFARDLASALGRSDLFFMAGAITFNVLVAGIPLLLFVTGVAGFVATARFGAGAPELVDLILAYIPAVEGNLQLTDAVRGLLAQLLDDRAGFTIVGALILLWISTRLIGTLRVVLREVFELGGGRGPIRGKLFDLRVVLVGGGLLLLNVGITMGLRALETFGVGLFGIDGGGAQALSRATGLAISFGSAWILFLLLYWHLPPQRVPFRTAAVGATFTAVVYEFMKEGFAWYATSVADYSNAYGSLAVVAVLFFWIYYSATVFIVGGLVAHVHQVRRRMRMDARKPDRGNGEGRAGALTVLLALCLCLPVSLSAQAAFAPFGGNGKNTGFLNGGEGVVLASHSLERDLSLDRPLVQHDGAYVVVHLSENRVLVMEGTEVVWSAPAGTGNGFELEGQGQEWTFTTPVGMFHVLRKEKDPLWLTPDWWYVQRGLAIPPSNQRAEVAGTLGTSALFLGDGIAIHGTDRPELLINFIDPDDRRVSHGCIRLTNEAARELYHRVSVGTPVLIF